MYDVLKLLSGVTLPPVKAEYELVLGSFQIESVTGLGYTGTIAGFDMPLAFPPEPFQAVCLYLQQLEQDLCPAPA